MIDDTYEQEEDAMPQAQAQSAEEQVVRESEELVAWALEQLRKNCEEHGGGREQG